MDIRLGVGCVSREVRIFKQLIFPLLLSIANFWCCGFFGDCEFSVSGQSNSGSRDPIVVCDTEHHAQCFWLLILSFG
jgi:hypothetical protein